MLSSHSITKHLFKRMKLHLDTRYPIHLYGPANLNYPNNHQYLYKRTNSDACITVEYFSVVIKIMRLYEESQTQVYFNYTDVKLGKANLCTPRNRVICAVEEG